MSYPIGWFSTGRGPGSRNLLTAVYDRIRRGDLDARISYVFSNRDPGEAPGSDQFFELVRTYGIPLITCSSRGFMPDLKLESREQWRILYDREIMKRLEHLSQNICVLAGYMLVVGPELCHQYDMINLHPAAPGGPTGTWQEVIWTLIETKALTTGVMMHLVTPELDKGPTVTYCTFRIRGNPFDQHWKEIEDMTVEEIRSQQGENNALFRLIRQWGAAREVPLIITTIKSFSEGVISVKNEEVVDNKGNRINGYDLTLEIEAILESPKRPPAPA